MKNYEVIKMNVSIYIRTIFSSLLIMTGIVVHAQTIPLTVISHPADAPADLKQSELKSILLGEKQRWKNGKKIEVALLKTNTAAGKEVCEKVYDMSADEVKKYWLAMVFQGKAEAPSFFNTVGELQAFVSENPGAIGIVDQIPNSPGVQVVMIDGKKTF